MRHKFAAQQHVCMSNILSQVSIGTLEIFCKVAELNSFKKASVAMGLTPAAISNSISRLENRLGVILFQRSTRSISLTTEGEILRNFSAPLISRVAEVERNIAQANSITGGVLRITTGAIYAHYRLSKIIPLFNQAYPGISVEMNISNAMMNLLDDSFDAAIRIGDCSEPSLMYKPLKVAPLGLFASPSYISRYGSPSTIDQLSDHKLIQFILPSNGKPLPWLLKNNDGQEFKYPYTSPIKISDNPMACVDLAVSGGGIVQTYDFVAEKYVARGELVEVLPIVNGATRTFHLVYKPNRYLSARIRAFIDFILASESDESR